MKVWVLTSEHNDYDQHGEYFITVFKSKPCVVQISAILGEQVSIDTCHHIVNGGGREKVENVWYYLREAEAL